MSDSSDSEISEAASDIDDLVSLAFDHVKQRSSGQQTKSCPRHTISPTDVGDVGSRSPSKCVPPTTPKEHDNALYTVDRRKSALIDSEVVQMNVSSDSDSSDDSDEDATDIDVSSLSDVKRPMNISKKDLEPKPMKFGKYTLSSSLSANIGTSDLYYDQLASTKPLQLDDAAKRLKALAAAPQLTLSDISRRQLKKQRRKEREMTKGKKWFDLPATEMTEERKNDLMVIQMRKVLDPKHFYKGSDIRGALPKYFQVGTIVEGRADFYSSRIPKKARKQTLVEELLADAEFRRYNKRKYTEIVEAEPRRRSKANKHMKRQKSRKK